MISWIKKILGFGRKLIQKDEWIYGTCNNRHARKHVWKGNVQFILWKAGQQGYKQDFWIDFGPGWKEHFKPTEDK